MTDPAVTELRFEPDEQERVVVIQSLAFLLCHLEVSLYYYCPSDNNENLEIASRKKMCVANVCI